MANNTLTDQLKILIQDEIQQQIPTPTTCTLYQTYDDPNYADIETTEGILKHIPKIGGSTIGAKGVVIFIDNDQNQPYAIIQGDDTT